jgi:hypothetical protein
VISDCERVFHQEKSLIALANTSFRMKLLLRFLIVKTVHDFIFHLAQIIFFWSSTSIASTSTLLFPGVFLFAAGTFTEFFIWYKTQSDVTNFVFDSKERLFGNLFVNSTVQ